MKIIIFNNLNYLRVGNIRILAGKVRELVGNVRSRVGDIRAIHRLARGKLITTCACRCAPACHDQLRPGLARFFI